MWCFKHVNVPISRCKAFFCIKKEASKLKLQDLNPSTCFPCLNSCCFCIRINILMNLGICSLLVVYWTWLNRARYHVVDTEHTDLSSLVKKWLSLSLFLSLDPLILRGYFNRSYFHGRNFNSVNSVGIQAKQQLEDELDKNWWCHELLGFFPWWFVGWNRERRCSHISGPIHGEGSAGLGSFEGMFRAVVRKAHSTQHLNGIQMHLGSRTAFFSFSPLLFNNGVCNSVDLIVGIVVLSLRGFALVGIASDFNWPHPFQWK